MKPILKPFSFLIVTITMSLSSFVHGQSNGFEVIRSLEQLDQIYEHLEKYYVDDIQAGNMAKIAFDAMLKELDPYTVYYHESNIEDYQLMTTGQYGGIGALIRTVDDFVYVAEPYEGKPADIGGLRAGDRILSIDGKDMEGKTSSEVSTALKGPKGTDVIVKIMRNGGKIEEITITRDEIKLPDVPYSGMLDNSIGYIKLNSFTNTASRDVKAAFTQLKSEGMEQLILDLRGNGGGLLIEAVRIVNMFVPKNEVIVTTQGRVVDENRVYNTLDDPMDLKIPLVVLVNGGSASASEIVAGSLQDLDRAVIIGTISYGKGLVQRTYDLDYGSKIKLTIAKYYTPSGRCVQRLEYYDRNNGESVEEVPDSLIKIFKTRNGRDVIDGRGVEPDVEVTQKDISRLAITILNNNLIFEFASKYFYSHSTIPPANEFALTEEEYESFKTFVLSEEFTYSTASEEMLKKMRDTAEEEGFLEDSEAEYEALLAKVVPSKERDLEKFKEQIILLLENEIVSRYYYQSGRAENSFTKDPFIKDAKDILQNLEQYDTILGK
ncbi:MAG: S41 family peptidase [Crocinitomicaceae bacterium]|nr:S41 family peptidase [Crocinitomicaceae bacterium]